MNRYSTHPSKFQNRPTPHRFPLLLMIFLPLLIALTGCAPGNPMYASEPAGFWAGLWHGAILLFTFLVGLFNQGVHVYEAANSGPLYDLGFVIGVAIFFGGGSCHKKFRKNSSACTEKPWVEVNEKVEEKIRKGIQNWLEESPEGDKDWPEIAGKIEEKIKRELRKWAEK